MAFCTHCGASLPEGAKFCSSCGASIGAAPPVADDTPASPVPPSEPAAATTSWSPPPAGSAPWTPPSSGQTPPNTSWAPPGSTGAGTSGGGGSSLGIILIVVGALVALILVLAVLRPWQTPTITGNETAAGSGATTGETRGGGETTTEAQRGGDGGSGGSTVADTPSAPPAPIADAPRGGDAIDVGSSVAVTAPTLHRAYLNDEAMAERMYAGRPITVSGVVSSVQLNTGDPTVAVEGNNRFVSVLMTFGPSARGVVASLPKGSTITARCTNIHEIAGTPILQNCRF